MPLLVRGHDRWSEVARIETGWRKEKPRVEDGVRSGLVGLLPK
jgi:hypothetical protein